VVEKISKIVTTPQTTAKLSLTQKQIDELPIGAVYEAKDGNASGTVRKTKDNNIEFTANCDSLHFMLEYAIKEVYRLNKEKTELKNSLKEEKIVEVNKLNGWQYFQIYGFRIYVILTIIYIVYIKWKK
jgi:NH3-dependent NAD+ synthetase